MFALPRAQVLGLTGLALVLPACSEPMTTFESELRDSYQRQIQPGPESGESADKATSSPAEAQTIDEHSTLEQCLAYAMMRSPDVHAAYYKWRADLQRIDQANSLPDPMLMLTQSLRRSEKLNAVGVSQTIPAWGKLELRGKEASQMADASRQRFEAATVDLRYRLAAAFDELQYVAGAVKLTEQNIQLLKSLEEVAATQYEVGAAGHADLVRLQVELAKTEDQLRQLNDRRAPLTARLNAAMDRPPDAPVPYGTAIEPMVLTLTSDELLAMLRQSNPELHGMDREIDAARTRTELARRERYPDFTFGLMYENMRAPAMGLNDPLLFSVGFNIPLWQGRNDAMLGEAMARRLAISADRAGRENSLVAELNEALFEHQDAHRRLLLYRDALIPKADEALSALLAQYQAGRGGFIDILDAERTLLEFGLAVERASADRAIALAKVEMIVGRALPTETDPGASAPAALPMEVTP